MLLSGPPNDLVVRLMDVASLRHDVIANNLANVNTPGFRAQEVRFEDVLARQWNGSQRGPITDVPATIAETVDAADRPDGNSVDMDREIGKLQKNALLFRMYSQVLATQLGQMRSAISGRS